MGSSLANACLRLGSKVSEFDQEMPQSHTAYQPKAPPQGSDTQYRALTTVNHITTRRQLKQSDQLSLLHRDVYKNKIGHFNIACLPAIVLHNKTRTKDKEKKINTKNGAQLTGFLSCGRQWVH